MAKAELADEASKSTLDTALSELIVTCLAIGEHLRPFLPDAADRIIAQCGNAGPQGGSVAAAEPTFPRLELAKS